MPRLLFTRFEALKLARRHGKVPMTRSEELVHEALDAFKSSMSPEHRDLYADALRKLDDDIERAFLIGAKVWHKLKGDRTHSLYLAGLVMDALTCEVYISVAVTMLASDREIVGEGGETVKDLMGAPLCTLGEALHRVAEHLRAVRTHDGTPLQNPPSPGVIDHWRQDCTSGDGEYPAVHLYKRVLHDFIEKYPRQRELAAQKALAVIR